MMMTAAGQCSSCKSFDSWCRSCWFASYCNCKRMGAIVFATDVRMASKEQVESLVENFLLLRSENLETEGGYAKETSEDFQRKQEELLSETLKKLTS